MMVHDEPKRSTVFNVTYFNKYDRGNGVGFVLHS